MALIMLDTPVDITPSATGVWEDQDVSAQVAAGAAGAYLVAKNTSGTNHLYGARKNGATDTLLYNISDDLYHKQPIYIGLDGNAIVETRVDTVDTTMEILGYFNGDDSTFFNNQISKVSGDTSGAYVEVDVTGDVTGTALGVIATMHDTSEGAAEESSGFRPGASSLTTPINGFQNRGYWGMAGIVDVSGSQNFEVETTNFDLYLVGYISANATFYTGTAFDANLGTISSTGVYADFPAIQVGNNAACWILSRNGGDGIYDIRKKGDTGTAFLLSGRCNHFTSAVDGDRVAERRADNSEVFVLSVEFAGGAVASNQTIFADEGLIF